jgi:hypothetical protein
MSRRCHDLSCARCRAPSKYCHRRPSCASCLSRAKGSGFAGRDANLETGGLPLLLLKLLW